MPPTRSTRAGAAAKAQAQAETETARQGTKRRGRPPGSGKRESKVGSGATTKLAKTSPVVAAHAGRKRKKPGAEYVGRVGDEEPPAKKKRGRPSNSAAEKDQPVKKKRGRPSNTPRDERPTERREKARDARNAETNNEPDEITEKRSQKKKYVQLVQRTRTIAQEKLDTWPQVSPQLLEQMVEVLRDAKKDIVNTQRDERRAALADKTLEILVRRLVRNLSSSKAPPQAKDMHFNLDKLTERYAQLFREMTKERHARQLLKEQIKVAQHRLEKEEENLRQLEKNAKHWKAEWKHQEKHERLHPLLEDLEHVEPEGDGPDDINLTSVKTVTDGTTAATLESPDPQLAPLLEQLRRSLENMQGNHEQIDGLDDAVQNAQVALDDVLFRHASAQQYAAL